jgi:hypothetical protein
MRFKFDKMKSEQLRKNPKRKLGFEEAKRFGNTHTTRTKELMIPNNIELSDG